MQYTSYIIQYTSYIMQYTLYIIHYTLYNKHHTLYNIHHTYTVTPLLCCNLAGLALGLAILEAIYFVYILLVLDYFMKELTL